MKAIRTPDTNVTLTLPGAGEDGELPATRAMLYDATRGQTERDATLGFVTKWQPDDAEARKLDAGACVEISIFGPGHPPIAVGVTDGVVPERELISRGHVNRAMGALYAALCDLAREAILQIQRCETCNGTGDIEPPADASPVDVRLHELTGGEPCDVCEGLGYVHPKLLVDTGGEPNPESVGLPSASAFADLWVAAVDAARPAEPTEEDRKVMALLDGLGIPDAPPADMPPGPRDDAEPLGTCPIHGDYWTDDCMRCASDRP